MKVILLLSESKLKKNVPKPITRDDDNQINILVYFHAHPQNSVPFVEHDLGFLLHLVREFCNKIICILNSFNMCKLSYPMTIFSKSTVKFIEDKFDVKQDKLLEVLTEIGLHTCDVRTITNLY